MKANPVFRGARAQSEGPPETDSEHPHSSGQEMVERARAYLTPRQLEVLQLLCEGLPNKLICRRLNISTGTVKVHISGILRELGVASRLQAVVAARRCGLLGAPAGAAAARAIDREPVGHGTPAGEGTDYGTLQPGLGQIGDHHESMVAARSYPRDEEL